MWIHIPSTRSASPAELKAWGSDYRLSSRLGRSVTWRGSYRRPRYFSRGYVTTPSMTHLFLRATCDPLKESVLLGEWILSIAESHVSPLVITASKKNCGGAPTSETFGPPSDNALLSLGYQRSFFSKTSKDRSDTFGTWYDPNFERWVTQLRRRFIAQHKPGVSTDVSEFSFWPTATVAEGGKVSNSANYGQIGLSNHPAIVGVVSRPKMAKSTEGDGRDTHITSGAPLPPTTTPGGPEPEGSAPRLSPQFVEALMGFCIGYSNASTRLETRCLRSWRRELLWDLRELWIDGEDFPIFSEHRSTWKQSKRRKDDNRKRTR